MSGGRPGAARDHEPRRADCWQPGKDAGQIHLFLSQAAQRIGVSFLEGKLNAVSRIRTRYDAAPSVNLACYRAALTSSQTASNLSRYSFSNLSRSKANNS